MAHPIHHLRPTAAFHHHRFYRRAPRWQLVNNGGIQIGVGTHGQCAGNGCGGHDELMGYHTAAESFLLQRQPLMHTETMLFINNDQGKIAVPDLFLEQGVGTHYHVGGAAFYQRQLLVTLPAFQLAR